MHDESVQLLTSILRADRDARPVLLLGAGASFSSGIPVAAECVRRISRRVFAERVKGRPLLPEQVKFSEWFPWLQQHPWFIPGEDRLAENFPLIVEHLLVPREYRKQVFLELLQLTRGIGRGYQTLAEMVLRGLFRTILTTNFDTCLPFALNEKRPHLRHFSEVNRSPGDLMEFDLFSKAQIVWLHGKAEQYSDRNLVDEVAHLDAELAEKLLPLLASSPLIVVGYRGAEPSVMEDLLLSARERTNNFRNGIFWCSRAGDSLHPNVEALRRAVGTNFQPLEILGFDELMDSLSVTLAEEDTYASQSPNPLAPKAAGFDDSVLPSASVQDLDLDLALVILKEYCQTLHRASVTSETLPALLRELGLLITEKGTEVPTKGCVLLFGRHPQTFFPQAVVSVSIAGKKRVVFDGNLIKQRRDLLDWLESSDVNPELQIKRRTVYERQSAYPPRVLVELVINQLVHRDYETEQPATIEVEPGCSTWRIYVSIRRNSRQSKRIDSLCGCSVTRQALKISDGTGPDTHQYAGGCSVHHWE
jgi:SIR2-like domain